MTENEAIKELSYDNTAYGGKCTEEVRMVAIQALEEIQQYRAIENELKEKYHANVDIKMLMQHFIETIFKGEKHEGFCILTNEDAKMWDAYRVIGTAEECRVAVERMQPKKPCHPPASLIWYCPNPHCPEDKQYLMSDKYKVCPDCGQVIDWSEKGGAE